ncbi:hypothetical protein EG68_02544 [Paragonimus skrjabini miyazakii]|uniref:Uncharacterized protein n=1 Tax=Paragonimus skrjabini miyazakii TaxID=59628 RepID=A0A8S9Z8Y6_9TREM|nr:hypothetical protein EG68_02544 [Paragonimus skrjabini miyazakii]
MRVVSCVFHVIRGNVQDLKITTEFVQDPKIEVCCLGEMLLFCLLVSIMRPVEADDVMDQSDNFLSDHKPVLLVIFGLFLVVVSVSLALNCRRTHRLRFARDRHPEALNDADTSPSPRTSKMSSFTQWQVSIHVLNLYGSYIIINFLAVCY